MKKVRKRERNEEISGCLNLSSEIFNENKIKLV